MKTNSEKSLLKKLKAENEQREKLKAIEIRNAFDWKSRHIIFGEYQIPYAIRRSVPTPTCPVTEQHYFEPRGQILKDATGRYFIARKRVIRREITLGEVVALFTRMAQVDGIEGFDGRCKQELEDKINRVVAAGIRAVGQDVPTLADLERIIR